jgi:hypothetical protein
MAHEERSAPFRDRRKVEQPAPTDPVDQYKPQQHTRQTRAPNKGTEQQRRLVGQPSAARKVRRWWTKAQRHSSGKMPPAMHGCGTAAETISIRPTLRGQPRKAGSIGFNPEAAQCLSRLLDAPMRGEPPRPLRQYLAAQQDQGYNQTIFI